MAMADLGRVQLHYRIDGPDDGAPVVLCHALGTDLHLWDGIMPLLPEGLRILRYDLRGHGQSACPEGPYSMGALVSDAEGLMQLTGFHDALFVGLSIGGMIGQGLAIKRLDLVRALVLSNTAAKIGNPVIWGKRIQTVQNLGMQGVVEEVLERWFTKAFLASDQCDIWRAQLLKNAPQGYSACAAAISGTDFYTPTSGLRLPCLGIAGAEDGSTPADMVRETADLIPGSQFQVIRRAGHLPCVEQPQQYAKVLSNFMKDIGHIS